MTILRILAGAIALCLFFKTAQACTTKEQLAAAIAARLPRAQVIAIEGPDAKAFMAAFNRLPPRSAFAADTILIADDPDLKPALRVAIFNDRCLIRAGLMPRVLVQRLLNAMAAGGA